MDLDYSRLLVLVIAAIVLSALVYWRPLIGFALYAASIGLDYMLAVYALRLPLFSLGQLMLLLLILIAILHRLRRPVPSPGPVLGLYFGLLFFVSTMWMSVGFSEDPGLGFRTAITTTFTALLPVVVECLVRTRRQVQWLLWAVGLGATLSAAIGVLQFAGVLPAFTRAEIGGDEEQRGRITEYRPADLEEVSARYSGPTENPNAFATVLMGGIPALYFLVLGARGLPARGMAISALGGSVLALLLTMSRTHIVAFAAFVTIFSLPLLMTGRMPRWAILIGAILVVSGFFYGLERLAGARHRLEAAVYDTSTGARWEIMRGGLRALRDHPVFGVGLNHTATAGYSPTLQGAHDVVSGVVGELGLAGALAVSFLFWQGFVLARSAHRRLDRQDTGALRGLPFFCTACLISLLVSGLGNTLYSNRALWMTLGLCVVAYRLSLERAPFAGASAKNLAGRTHERARLRAVVRPVAGLGSPHSRA